MWDPKFWSYLYHYRYKCFHIKLFIWRDCSLSMAFWQFRRLTATFPISSGLSVAHFCFRLSTRRWWQLPRTESLELSNVNFFVSSRNFSSVDDNSNETFRRTITLFYYKYIHVKMSDKIFFIFLSDQGNYQKCLRHALQPGLIQRLSLESSRFQWSNEKNHASLHTEELSLRNTNKCNAERFSLWISTELCEYPFTSQCFPACPNMNEQCGESGLSWRAFNLNCRS